MLAMTTTELTIDSLLPLLLPEVASTLIEISAYESPNEAVGILCLDGTIFPLINQARSGSRYIVSNRLFNEAINELTGKGLYPVGVYHSHPNRDHHPSTPDRAFMEENAGVISIIVSVQDETVAAWTYDGEVKLLTEVEV